MQKFCYVCGKATNKLINGMCEDCFKDKSRIINVPEILELITCSKCGHTKIKNNWKDINVENILKDKIKILGENVKLEIKKTNNDLKVSAKGLVKGVSKPKEETHSVYLHYNKVLCPDCIRKYGNYYESTLQLRGNIPDSTLQIIENEISFIKDKDRKAFYRIEKVKGGLDLFFGSKSAAEKVAESLRKRFQAEIKRSFKLFTRKEGKDIYREVISVRT